MSALVIVPLVIAAAVSDQESLGSSAWFSTAVLDSYLGSESDVAVTVLASYCGTEAISRCVGTLLEVMWSPGAVRAKCPWLLSVCWRKKRPLVKMGRIPLLCLF